MGSRKRIEITLKARQTLVVRGFRKKAPTWCLECAGPSQMITPDEAAVLTETSTREIYRLIESGRLHFIETEDGLLLLCLASLQAVRNALLGRP